MQLIFSIITFALVADYTGNSKINFVLFTGITAMLMCLAFLVFYLLGAADNPTLVLVELVMNAIWWVFWLAAAACLADIINNGWFGYVNDGSKVQASCAFAWLTWVLWTISTGFSIKELMGRNSARSSGNVPMGTQPAVAMV